VAGKKEAEVVWETKTNEVRSAKTSILHKKEVTSWRKKKGSDKKGWGWGKKHGTANKVYMTSYRNKRNGIFRPIPSTSGKKGWTLKNKKNSNQGTPRGASIPKWLEKIMFLEGSAEKRGFLKGTGRPHSKKQLCERGNEKWGGGPKKKNWGYNCFTDQKSTQGKLCELKNRAKP